MKKLTYFGVGFVLLLLGFSYFGGNCLNNCEVTNNNNPSKNIKTQTAAFRIDGMSCPDCAVTIKQNLMKDKGIVSSNIEYNSKINTVTFNPKVTNTKEISGIIKTAGFNAKLANNERANKNSKKSVPSSFSCSECK